VLGHFPLQLGRSFGPQTRYESRLRGAGQRKARKDDQCFSGHSIIYPPMWGEFQILLY
jgi:hypothetical protein